MKRYPDTGGRTRSDYDENLDLMTLYYEQDDKIILRTQFCGVGMLTEVYIQDPHCDGNYGNQMLQVDGLEHR